MARWTTNPAEVHHFAEIAEQVLDSMVSGPVTVVMRTGSRIIAFMNGIKADTNGAQGPAVQQWGKVRLSTETSADWVDFLDIETTIFSSKPGFMRSLV
jgi:hypothetical protein